MLSPLLVLREGRKRFLGVVMIQAPKAICTLLDCMVVLALMGCGRVTQVAPTVSPVSPLASPVEQPMITEADTALPTPVPGKGVVTGVLVHYTFDGPIPGVTVYLAPVLASDDGKMEMAKFVKEDSPATTTDADGRFLFVGVDPGRYAVILGGVVDDYLLSDFQTQEEIVFGLDGDQLYDAGEIRIVPPGDV